MTDSKQSQIAADGPMLNQCHIFIVNFLFYIYIYIIFFLLLPSLFQNTPLQKQLTMAWMIVSACVSRLFSRSCHHHQQYFSFRLYHPSQKSFPQSSNVIRPESKIFTPTTLSSVAAATRNVIRISPNFQVFRTNYSQR